MNLKVLACNVFFREVCLCVATSPHVIDLEFTDLGEHVHSDSLREKLQARIDAIGNGGRAYDAIVLCFGICGNATVGLAARQTPLVMPRAHDCCAILLGSPARFREHFESDPSTPFGSTGYMERGEYYLRTADDGQVLVEHGDVYRAYVEQYGEENAQYIWETLHPRRTETQNRAVFIDIPELRSLGWEARFRRQAEGEGRAVVALEGDLAWLRELLHGPWNPERTLTVPPGFLVSGVYDWTEVIRAAPPAQAPDANAPLSRVG
jgi:hypothetical protein